MTLLPTVQFAASILDYGGQVFNVKHPTFGAVGDNVTDDTAAIQAAATAAAGANLFFPLGTYKITSRINISASCNVIMAAGAIVRQYTESQSVFGAISVSNVKFRDCAVDYNTTNVRQTQGAIQITGCANFEIIGSRVIKSPGMGFYTANNQRGRILSNIVENTLADGIHVTNGGGAGMFSKDISIVNNICNNTGDDSIAVVSYTAGGPLINEAITITGNVVDTCATRSITVAGGKFITITGNTIRGATGSTGINVILDESFVTFAAEEVVISSNVIEPAAGASASTRAGIRVYRSHRVLIVGNIVDWEAGEGIIVYGKGDDTDDALDCKVISNIVRGTATGEQGIHGQRANRLALTGNTIINAAKSGIYAEICDNVLIDGNVLDESNQQNVGGTNLLTVTSGAGATIVNNTIRQTTTNFTHAITIASQTGATRHGNNIYNVTSTMAGVLINISASNVNPSMSADRGDTSQTLTYGTDSESQRWGTALTANRAVTLATTGTTLYHGAKFFITRSGGDTGGPWNLTVNGKNLLANQWIIVEWDAGSGAWRNMAFGSL